MIIHYVEDEQDVAGWGLFLRHVRGDSDTRAYIGCRTPEEAVSTFLKESEAFSRDDILEVTPIWDYRAFKKASVMEQTQSRRLEKERKGAML